VAEVKYVLDIGSSKMSLFAFMCNKSCPIIVASSTRLYDGFMDGEFLEPTLLADTVRELVSEMTSKLKTKIKKIYVGVPSEFCLCVCKRKSRKFLKVTKISEDIVRELYDGIDDYQDAKGYKLISVSPLQFVLDSGLKTINPIKLKTSQITMDCSYLMAKLSFVKKFDTILGHLQIKEVEYLSETLGQGLLCNKTDVLEPKIVVDVGHITTNVGLVKGEGLALVSSFSLGGGHITADIMQLLQKSFKEAELIKRKVALTLKPNKDDKYIVQTGKETVSAHIQITNDIVRSRIENIATVVNNIIDVDESFADVPIYLTGDGVCNFKGAINIFEEICNRKIIEFKLPFDNTMEKFQTSKLGLAELATRLEN